ncbi:MAG TPA: type IV pili methyl-accepting chemotaxis transducer N-terminal domain-containing protein [Anaerolineales bacterium]|nr:type IV pili methyl-accepting chemotaxis transducer N-terminal domain-containing protein [Anaerolineales bacterium]
MRLLFIAFFLLVAVSVGATYWGLHSQASDALVINLAGRQRMLIQQMTLLAFRLGKQGDSTDQNPQRAEIQLAVETFTQTLHALQSGGQIEYPAGSLAQAPPARDPATRLQLQRVAGLWAPYRAALEVVLDTQEANPELAAALDSIESRSPELVAEMDLAVRLYQASADRRSANLRLVQVFFFAGALGLLAAGGLVAHSGILEPLKRLNLSAQRIGAGDLDTAVKTGGLQEIQMLSETFDRMRARLNQSQQELLGWNQRLEARVDRRTQELEALYDVSREISSRLDLDQVLNSVAEKARGLLRAETAYLCLLDTTDQALRLQAFSGSPGTLRQVVAPAGNPFVHSVLSDTSARSWDAGGCPQACGIIAAEQRASHLAAPLWAGDRVIGALCVASRQPGAFSAEAPALLTRLANVAAIALENAGMYSRAERMAALEERQRIAAAMHDGLAQMIDSLGLLVDQAGEQIENGAARQAGQTLARARDRVAQASTDVRSSIASLQDNPPPPKNLQTQLSDLLEEFSRTEDGRVDWQVDLEGSLYLTEDDAQQVLGIAREALTNARRYAGANRISLGLGYADHEASLTVEDDGCGFDTSAASDDGRQHFGLKILQARAAHLQGKIEVCSKPGDGTRLHLVWPIRQASLPLERNREALL